MKIIVNSGYGRQINPHLHYGAIRPLTDLFEQSVQSYPAPGIADGEHEAELIWQIKYDGISWINLPDRPMAIVQKYNDTRQIWQLTPKAK